MTRINANIKPAHLIDQHLIAEYREIVRIPNYVHKNTDKAREALNRAPDAFKLNSGHVLFFYDKNNFLHKRFLNLKIEMSRRNIENNMTNEMFFNIDKEFYNDIDPVDLIDGNKEIVERILLRISTMKKTPTINSKPIDFDQYKKMLLKNYE